MKTIGVDLGGTNIKAALVDEQGKILKEKSVKTNLPRPAERVCDDIAALCNELAGGQQMAGIGVGGGVVLEGKLLTGYTGAAAEPGHMVILDTPDAALHLRAAGLPGSLRQCYRAYPYDKGGYEGSPGERHASHEAVRPHRL